MVLAAHWRWHVFFGGPSGRLTRRSRCGPQAATGANILVGGLGNGNWDMDVDKVGLIYTCVVSYGIPSVLSILSVGVQSTQWYMEFFDDMENVVKLIALGMGPFGILLGVGSQVIGVYETLITASQFIAGLIFSPAYKPWL